MSSEEATAAGEGKKNNNITPRASPTKTDAAATATADNLPNFTEKEERVLKIAWFCLKSGPPEIDMAKLTEKGGFNTAKTASNTWGVIKKKLMACMPAEDKAEIEGEANGDGAGAAATKSPKTPKTPVSTTKKRGKKTDSVVENDGVDNQEEAAAASPEKKKRKSPVKKSSAEKKVKAEADVEKEEQQAKDEKTEEDVKMEGDE